MYIVFFSLRLRSTHSIEIPSNGYATMSRFHNDIHNIVIYKC